MMGKFQLTKVELIIYAALSILAALWCYYRWTLRHFIRISAKIKKFPAYPIIGSSLEFVGSQKQILKNIMRYEKKYCPEPIGIWFGPIFIVLLSKPEDIQIILNSSKALDKSKILKMCRHVLGEGLILAPIDKWKKHRRIIAPAFNSNVIQHFIPMFYDSNKKFIKNLEEKVGETEPFNLWDYISIHSTELVCQTTLGYPTSFHPDMLLDFKNALETTLKTMIMNMGKPWLYPDVVFNIYKKLTGINEIYKSVLKLPLQIIHKKKQALVQQIISNEREENIKEEIHLKTFLDILLDLNQTGTNITEQDIFNEVLTVILAGSDSMTSTLCFCLLLLAIHQNIQNKVYSEIHNVLGDNDKKISIKEVHKLVYLDQVLKETLRLYTAVPYFVRNLQDGVKISSGDLVLPRGTIVIISANATHHLPELYPNPWAFNPENFSQENIDKRHSYSFIPFSGGPRNCLGTKYAMLSMKMFLAMFLLNFSVHTEIELKDIELDMDVTLKNSNGFPVTIQSRNRTTMG